MPPSFDEQQNNAIGCLFLLLWVCIVLELAVLALFAFASYVAQRSARLLLMVSA